MIPSHTVLKHSSRSGNSTSQDTRCKNPNDDWLRSRENCVSPSLPFWNSLAFDLTLNITVTDVWYCCEIHTFAMVNPRWDTTHPAIPLPPFSFTVLNIIGLTSSVAVCVLPLSVIYIWLLQHCTPRATDSMWQRISVQGLHLSNASTPLAKSKALGRQEGFDRSQLLELLMCFEATGWTLDLNLSPSHNSHIWNQGTSAKRRQEGQGC